MEDIQVQRRQDRARAAQFEISNLGDHPVFSRFHVVSGASGRTYEVTIRSLRERANTCTCPDFLTNLVGTCKHVEAVLLSVTPPGPEGEGLEPIRPQVYLHHGEELAVRLLWTPNPLAGGASVEALLERYFRPDGTFRGDLAQEFEGFREAAQRSGQVDIAPEVVALVADLRELALLAAERDRWLARLAAGETLAVTALPLYRYQERGALHLAYGRRALLADDLGLGKTVQAIAAAELLRREGRVKRTLIVCPSSVRQPWKKEIFRFTGQEAAIADGTPAQRAAVYASPKPYVIAGYEHLVRDEKELARLAPELIVLDEAQRIRDWRSDEAHAVKRLTSPFAFVLSGTPLESRLDDLYSVMQFVDQRLLGPLWRFNQRYYVLGGGDARQAKVVGYKNLDELRARLARVMLRRTRADVADELPERIQSTFEVALLEPQRAPYDEARDKIARVLGRGRPPTAAEREQITRHLARMRMACDAAELVGGDSGETPPKLSELERILADVLEDPAAKVVVCTEWEKMVHLVGRMLDGLGLGWLALTGRVPVEKRAALIEKFRADRTLRVLVATDVGGAGLDLDEARWLVNVDVPWSPARVEQRVARILTAGQRKTVNVVNLVAAGTIEDAIHVLSEKKRALHDDGVDADGERMPIPTLSGQLDLSMLSALITPEPVAAALENVPGGEAAAVLAEFSGLLDAPGGGLAAMLGAVAETARPTPPALRRPELPRGRPAPLPAGPHPGRNPGQLPTDPFERQQAVRRIFAEALGSSFCDLAPLGAGFVVHVARVDPRLSVQVGGIAARLGVPAVAVDADGLASLKSLVAPLVNGTPDPAAATEQRDQAQVRRERGQVKLAEARCLLSGGLGPAALRAARDAMELALEALCLAHTGRCPPPADLVGELYGRLVRDGIVPLDLAAGVSRARDLSHVAEGRGRALVDVTVARAVVHDADSLLKLCVP